MPGIFPSNASSRKQMRQRLKSRIKPRGRPHLKQRRTVRDENFGFRAAFTTIDRFAIILYLRRKEISKPLHPALRLWVMEASRGFISRSLRRGALTKKQSPLRGPRNIREIQGSVKQPHEARRSITAPSAATEKPAIFQGIRSRSLRNTIARRSAEADASWINGYAIWSGRCVKSHSCNT